MTSHPPLRFNNNSVKQVQFQKHLGVYLGVRFNNNSVKQVQFQKHLGVYLGGKLGFVNLFKTCLKR